MTIEPQPNRIELSDFSGGFNPDAPEASVPAIQFPDALNLLPNPSTKHPELRKGYVREETSDADQSESRGAGLDGYFIRHMNYYEVIVSGRRERMLVCIFTNTSDGTNNNVQVWVLDLKDNTFERVDTAGRAWTHADTEHWYAVVEGVYYGGSRGEVMYSWDPTNGWNADPSTPDVKTWVDAVDGGVTVVSEYGRDFAFKEGTLVTYSSKFYTSMRGIRFDTWEDGQRYQKGDQVSIKSGLDYWKSWQCTEGHVAASGNKPGSGADYADVWKKKRLPAIKDEDGDITDAWAYVPLAGKSSVGIYHGFRLWLRHDDNDNWARLQYSAPAKPERDAVIADLDWHPKDWAPVDDEDGDGGGWMTIPFRKGDAIRALASYGQYLIVFGRWESFVLTGSNEQTWTLRKLADAGTMSSHGVAELDGLVYFLSPEGRLYVTDATSVQAVPGGESVNEYLKNRIDLIMVGEDDYNYHPKLTAYNKKLWISLPDADSDAVTVVYEPVTQSFWPLDLPTLAVATGAQGRAERMWFSEPVTQSTTSDFRPTVFRYMDDPGDEVWTDDDSEEDTAAADFIEFRARTAWMQFGTTRNERRIRRVWWLLGDGVNTVVTVNGYRNFSVDTPATSAQRLPTAVTREAHWVEGKHQPDSYAVSLEVTGTTDEDFSILGAGVDTEPRRTRFHRGEGS